MKESLPQGDHMLDLYSEFLFAFKAIRDARPFCGDA